MPWPDPLDDFRDGGAIEPELCFVVRVAAGCPMSIRWKLSPRRDRVKRWDDGPSPGKESWDWYPGERRRFHPTPGRTAAAFVPGHGERAARHSPAMACLL